MGFDGGGAPIVRSVDGGQTWTLQVFPLSSIIRDVDMVSASVGYAAAGARIIKSTDGFATWSVVRFGENFFDVSFVDENNGWALGLDDTLFAALYHTTDGGRVDRPTHADRSGHSCGQRADALGSRRQL